MRLFDNKGGDVEPYLQVFEPLTTPPMTQSRPFVKPAWCAVKANVDFDNICTNDEDGQGQVKFSSLEIRWNPTSSFAAALYFVASLPSVHFVLEIGSFKGCGSTLVLAHAAMEDTETCIIGFEVDPKNFALATSHVADLPV